MTSKEERKRLLIEMMKEDEKNGMYDTDLIVSDWLKSVTPEMYQATSAIREVIRHHDGTKAKMLIATVIEQYVASQFKSVQKEAFTLEDMREAFEAGVACEATGETQFDEWIKTL